MTKQFLFRNMQLLDPRWDEARGGYEVLVEGDTIREVSSAPIKSGGATTIDCGGKTLMPGLIDCHAHVYLVEVGIGRLESMPLTLLTAKASVLLKQMLERGFTTVRDTGGADWGIKEAVENGTLAGPRLFISGQAIGPTGGHSDSRRRTQFKHQAGCHCCDALSFITGIADGVDGVRQAVREQMRQGADQIKLMLSGGVASPWDPLDSLQFSVGEIKAAVEEAHAFGRYVLAHAYTPEAITRGVENGVRTIEHGNLIDESTARLMSERNALMVANLVTYYMMKEEGRSLGLSASQLEKNDLVIEGGLRSLEICKRAGVPVGFGSDLLGKLQVHQSREFLFRAEVLSPIEIIRQATLVGAQVVRREGKLGVIEPGAFADLIVVDGNPVKDLWLFQDQGVHLSAIMKAGAFHKNRL
ncbi:MAG: amidohydrolase family protein [Alphaproteobacteria bacterium]|nr:amidohydrolase family protein [Alphaproteobacteria bacterium]